MVRWLLLLLGALYVISPFDCLPDFMFLRGWIDDLLVLYLLYRYYLAPFLEARRASRHTAGPAADEARSGTRTEAEAGDPRQVLGVSADATADDIQRAYRRLAARYHPDKVAHLGEEFRRLAEQRFKEIQAAYQELKLRRG